jgi:hypothetical protein
MISFFARWCIDEQNKPVNWPYLEINDPFKGITDLKRGAAEGKRVTEVTPRIKLANPEFFEIFGRVDPTRQEERFEMFFKPSNLSTYFEPGERV